MPDILQRSNHRFSGSEYPWRSSSIEYGGNEAIARSVSSAGLRFAARTLTADDHVQRGYVAYMLQQAVHLARGRKAVVMARPFPGTLQAFEDLLTRASRDGVRFVGL